MSPELQERFDKLLEDAFEALLPAVRQVIEEVPVIVEDRPDAELLAKLRRDGVLEPAAEGDQAEDGTENELMGLHSGVAITEQSVTQSGTLPPTIHVFREGIVEAVGGWEVEHADEEIYEEIRITLLHEIGHHFGLSEEDLDDLGYA